jgi:hypothetical protein
MVALTLGFFDRLATLITTAKGRGEVAADLDVLRATYNVFGLYFLGTPSDHVSSCPGPCSMGQGRRWARRCRSKTNHLHGRPLMR